MAEPDRESPVERGIARSFEDTQGFGKPLSRRARQTRRSVEAYLKAGVLPRYMERLREIDRDREALRTRIERSYRALQEECSGDPQLFARLWPERSRSWRFDHLNDLIRGRSYRREELGTRWVLRQFPAELPTYPGSA